MKPFLTLLLGLACITPMLTGCSSPDLPPIKQEGEIDLSAPHVLTPKDGELYRVRNLKRPGEKAFIFPNEEALVHCYEAVETGKNVQETCWLHVEAEVEDGALVRAVECHNAKHAICTVQLTEGEASGVKGTIMWDWLAPREATPGH